MRSGKKKEKPFSEEDRRRYGEPLLVYGSGKEVIVFWRKESNGSETYTATVFDPKRSSHKRVGSLEVDRMADEKYVKQLTVKRGYRKRGIGTALHSLATVGTPGRTTLFSYLESMPFWEKQGYVPKSVWTTEGLAWMSRKPGTRLGKVYVKPSERKKRNSWLDKIKKRVFRV